MKARRNAVGPDSIVRWVLAAILLAAAGMKIEQLATTPANNCGQLSCRWAGILEAEAEILLGLWLLSGIAKSYSHAMAGICFAAFSIVTAYKAFHGDASCGCFGRLEVQPWYTLVLDVAAVAAVLLFRPRAQIASPASAGRVVAWLATAAVVVALAAWPMIVYRPASLQLDGRIDGHGAVLLSPADWHNHRLPLLAGNHIVSEADLANGNWTLILYRRNCRTCRAELAEQDRQARRLREKNLPCRVAIAQLPANDPSWAWPWLNGGPGDIVPDDSPLVRARLDDSRAWFIATPLVITMRDGKVLSVTIPRD